ncbi:MAG: methylmalonyl-CoA epimerase [Anaerolineae bacterium]|jgi:methylmalonyl-CoA epimerase
MLTPRAPLGKRIDHIAIVVHDLDAALKVYCDVLGLSLARVEVVPAEGVKIAFLPLSEGHSEIELVQPIAEDTGIARYLTKRGEGMHHICLEVDDIQSAMTEMAAGGLQILEEKPRLGSQGQKYVFIHPKTTHGVLIELYERPE